MIDDETYDRCRVVLDDKKLNDEEKTEQLEELLKADYTGESLSRAVLDALWRHRNADNAESSMPFRGTIIRQQSPAPWQVNRAPTPLASPPLGSSPGLLPAIPASRPGFARQKSGVPSPFASPRPSPRLALAQPIPHSPNLNAYVPADHSPTPEIYGDYGSDNVDWLVADDLASNASSTGAGTLSAAAPEWQPQPDMSPYDILRSVLGDKKTNEEIEEALEKSSYDLGQTIALLTGTENPDTQLVDDPPLKHDGSVLIGKSMTTEQIRPVTPNAAKSPVVCKYWASTGSCLRADCRFAHDTSNHICKYWLSGSCLAGDSCQFSHDPSAFMASLSINESSAIYSTPPYGFQLQDQMEQFPSLQNQSQRSSSHAFVPQANGQFPTFTPMSQQRGRGGHHNQGNNSRPHSRPNSRHQNRADAQSSLSMDDPEAFPTLASMNVKRSSKHHGPRSRHGHSNLEKETPSSLADVVRSSPSPAPGQRKSEVVKKTRSSGPDSSAAMKIPQPQHIPWLETGERANQQYLKYRQEAIKHGSIRNKFLQSAAQAWNRNDSRAAKALSLRGQAENDAMRKAHREAAKALYEERNRHLTEGSSNTDEEMYVDLHGLHPEEVCAQLLLVIDYGLTGAQAIEYLENVLVSHSKKGPPIIYAITGTGHHSKNGKDRVGKGVRSWLQDCGYTFREFSISGERSGYMGGVLGIDVTSHRHQALDVKEQQPVARVGGKIQVLKRDEVAV
jgi:Domain of unknown function (DUF1771)/RNA-binding, Nab2-type zinc finger